MIEPKKHDSNRSKDVPGPLLEREPEMEMKMENDMGSFTGVIEKLSLKELHEGNEETPLVATGKQEVIVKMKMGSMTEADDSSDQPKK